MKIYINRNIKSLTCLCGVILFFGILTNCHHPKKDTLFKKLDSDKTGITFTNVVVTDDSTNALLDPYIYNGGGVAIGDLNNDGLQDIILTGSMVKPHVYLNKGDFNFEDITSLSGINTDKRVHGVSLVDINSDGFIDVYFSASGPAWSTAEQRKNLLFINNGDNTFTESAAQYGIDDSGFTTQSAFLDYDNDGDLDLFLLNNSPEEFSRGDTGSLPLGNQDRVNPDGFDRFYRNNGDGTFSNVSGEAGMVRKLGYGLGLAISDLNGDGRPDIYVSNDMTPNDVLYINNGDGTFTDRASEWLRHTSHSGMGIDIADYDNNGWPDIVQSDMMHENILERKRMSGAITYYSFKESIRQGLFPHYSMNTLQLNQGVSHDGTVNFSEVARLAGVAYTHWSWSSLFADFDNDGFKDLLITNGFPIAGNDYDHLNNLFSAQLNSGPQELLNKKIEIFENAGSYKVPNYVFRNNGDLTFSDMSESWGLNQPGFSYGAAYADLDNDGHLDLVINNINSSAWVYKNEASQEETSHSLTVKLEGQSPNTSGIGAKLWVWAGGKQQFKYQNPYRGFMSSMDPRLHFGLGSATFADSLRVVWPDGRTQLLRDIPADTTISLNQHHAVENKIPISHVIPSENQIFQDISGEQSLSHTDPEKSFEDYGVQPLLPYMISRQGPPLASADVNGDGLEDLYIGGSAENSGRLYLQQADGSFLETDQPQPWQADSGREDWGALFFDANGDGLPDLYVASGGYHSSPASLLLQDRLYINYGNGRFLKNTDALPRMLTSTAAIAPNDFNGDGQMDLFIGGRLTPRNWPHPTRSYLLRNDGGHFTDVTRQMLPQLIEPGSMITDALWADIDGNGQEELVTTGQWDSIHFYRHNGEQFEDITGSMDLPPLRGWWESLTSGDFNDDGRLDFAIGNLGLNHTYTASPESPFGVVAVDMTGNRVTDIILTKEIDGIEYPFHGLAKLGREIYTLSIAFDSFESFSRASVEQVVGNEKLNQALHYQADTFASVVLLSDGNGSFSVRQMPNMAQISPIQDMVTFDVDKNGHLDLIIGGNLYETEPIAPRVDAGNGLWLRGDGRGEFTPVAPQESGLLIPKDVRNLALIETPKGPQLIVSNNADSIRVFVIKSN